MTIREKLIKIRSDSGLSQQEFADKLNVARQTVTRWEAGRSTPSSAQILNICNVFGLDANEFLEGGIKPGEANANELRLQKAKKLLPFIGPCRYRDCLRNRRGYNGAYYNNNLLR